MMNIAEVYVSTVPDWATQVELVVHEPNQQPIQPVDFDVRPEAQVQFVVATVSTPNGLFPPFLDARLELYDPTDTPYHLSPTPGAFVSSSPGLVVIESPIRGVWKLSAISGVIPYAVTAMAFHPQVSPNSPPSPGSSGSSPFKCRACKTTAKALALAIVAAATLPTLPAALIAAVSAYLGVGAVFAAAFISSVLGDTADVIAEKLCKKVGLC
jgi:hypothetical protein